MLDLNAADVSSVIAMPDAVQAISAAYSDVANGGASAPNRTHTSPAYPAAG
jgi:hypothetical protein